MPLIHYCTIRNGDVFADGKLINSFPYANPLQMTEAMYDYFDLAYPKFYKMDPICRLGMLASHILFTNSNIKQTDPYKTAIVLSNREGSGDTDMRFQHSISQAASPSLFVYTLPNIVIGEICIRFQIKGEQIFIVQDSYNCTFMNNYIQILFEKSLADRCLTGWIDVLNENHNVFLYFLKPAHFQLGEKELNNLLTELYQQHGSINIYT